MANWISTKNTGNANASQGIHLMRNLSFPVEDTLQNVESLFLASWLARALTIKESRASLRMGSYTLKEGQSIAHSVRLLSLWIG